MNKSYIWVVLVFMGLTMFTILIEKGIRKSRQNNEIIKEEIVKDDKEVQDTSTAVKPDIKSEDEGTTSVPKGKLPAGSDPVAPASVLQGDAWVWQKTILKDNTVITPKKEGGFTLLMKSDGNVSGKTDCNGFFGDYKIGSDGFISFGPLASTEMYCEGSQEKVYTDAISKSARYILDNSGNLIFALSDGAGAMFFKKQ